MDVELQKSKSTKQRKISTMNLQKLRERLGRAVSNFILYNRIPFNVVDSECTQSMLDVAAKVGAGVKGPGGYEVSEVYLNMEHDEMTEWIRSFKEIWTAEYYFGLLDKVVDEIGEQYVVQVVIDNEPALKATGKIGWVLDLMRKFTGNRELIRLTITRFATNFIAIKSIVRYKQQLRAMFNSDEWKNSKWGKAKTGQPYKVKKIILGKEFWQKAIELCKVHEPLVRVLRLVNGDEKPTMDFIYEAIDRAKLAIKRDCHYYTEYWKIIDTRWSFQLQ
ncbi:uncharacterized protein LOC114315342 [Camellia sinensis]|uniref:uncharacterized protein LOC114315342 n=1 Tax=Camellia sinensis TaxID=4442 RepID=UPI001035A56B|nr:uncharacterized protein LOC114315342 [Camellia sinensis]